MKDQFGASTKDPELRPSNTSLINKQNPGKQTKKQAQGNFQTYFERSKYREQLTSEDWGLIFEELINRDLIELPESYTKEKK